MSTLTAVKQLFISKKIDRLGYKGGRGVHGHCTCIKGLKEELAWATDKWIEVSSSIMLFKTVTSLWN